MGTIRTESRHAGSQNRKAQFAFGAELRWFSVVGIIWFAAVISHAASGAWTASTCREMRCPRTSALALELNLLFPEIQRIMPGLRQPGSEHGTKLSGFAQLFCEG